MIDIVALLRCLHPEVTMTTIRQFSTIALALLAMTGRVTMLGISRWTADGGSYRTVQRFSAPSSPGPRCSGCSFAHTCSTLAMSICWPAMKRSSPNLASTLPVSTASLPLCMARAFLAWPSSPSR